MFVCRCCGGGQDGHSSTEVQRQQEQKKREEQEKLQQHQLEEQQQKSVMQQLAAENVERQRVALVQLQVQRELFTGEGLFQLCPGARIDQTSSANTNKRSLYGSP